MEQENSQYPLADYAELLGAVYGDGYIQKRGKESDKVVVTVSDKYPGWVAQVEKLFLSVFGRFYVYEKKMRTNRRFFEYYITTQTLWATFRITSKYTSDHRLVPPDWINKNAEYRRRFLRSLVETDGMFTTQSGNSDSVVFSFAQKDKTLIDWVAKEVSAAVEGEPSVHWAERAQVWNVTLKRQSHVVTLGEWLQSDKWRAVLAGGAKPELGRKSQGITALRWAGIEPEIQDEWRRLRIEGASVLSIARHYGRANNIVHAVVRDIVPTKNKTAEELGLIVKPRFPMEHRVPRSEVEEWRTLTAAGIPCREIAQKFGRKLSMVNEATCDVVRPAVTRSKPAESP